MPAAAAATVLWTILMVFGFGEPFRWGSSALFFAFMSVVYVTSDRRRWRRGTTVRQAE